MNAAGFDFFAASSPAAATAFLFGVVVCDDVEEIAGNTGICEVRGYAGAHGSGAENRDFMNSVHEVFSYDTTSNVATNFRFSPPNSRKGRDKWGTRFFVAPTRLNAWSRYQFGKEKRGGGGESSYDHGLRRAAQASCASETSFYVSENCQRSQSDDCGYHQPA